MRRRLDEDDGTHEFHALNTLLLVVVLGLCLLSAYLIKKYRFYFMPESSAALCVGLVVGGIARLITHSDEELDFLSVSPELFFFLPLPPIIFEAGYTLRRKNFFRNLGTITMYAVVGTLISTFVVGYFTYACARAGIVDVDATNPMEALLFGALISAVDPVATLSIIGSPELNCDPLLYSLVFGESVLNDAVAIVLFKTFMKAYDLGEEFSGATLPKLLWDFCSCSFGSLVIGIATALTCAYLCKHTQMKKYPELEISMLFLFAYGSYAFSEALELSGIMALFFCGICLSHYNSYNLSATSKITSNYIFKSLAVMSDFFVFLYMGMGFFIGQFKEFYFLFILLVVLFCLIARLFNTFPFSVLANLGRSKIIPFKMQVLIWFAGLRGAIAFALSQNMPGAHRDVYVSTTLAVVIITTLVCGGLTEHMLTRMGLRLDTNKNDVDDDHQYQKLVWNNNAEDPSASQLAATPPPRRPREREPRTGLRSFWHRFDTLYMKPYFGGSSDRDRISLESSSSSS